MSDTSTPGRPRFEPRSALHDDLERRVDQYFEETGYARDGGGSAILKATIIIAWAVASYLLLLLWASSWWTAIPLAISLGLALAGIGFSVMHDGNHRAFSSNTTLNWLSGATLDLIGGSSYIWRYKHNIIHHTYSNIDGVDDDLDAGGFLRMAPTQPHRWFHRGQRFYELPVLGLLAAKWHLFDDWACLWRGKIGTTTFPRPKGVELALLVFGKVFFFTWAVVLPFMLHPVLPTVVVCAITSIVLGMTLGIVFQLAHVCADTLMTVTPPDCRLPTPWAEHQIATTADFAPTNRWINWYVGGLNFQIEHHLFPRIGHVHYPKIASIVRETCVEHGVKHVTYDTFGAALGAHFAFLDSLGRRPLDISNAPA